jgi:hypothetical protein
MVIDIEDIGLRPFLEFHQVVRKTFSSEAHVLVLAPDKSYIEDLPADIDLMIKPIEIDQLSIKMRDMLSESYSSASGDNIAGLQGNLKDLDLPDIIQILNMGLKTAKLEITRGKEKGILYLTKGKIVHASLGSIIGPNAFYELMGWGEGKFSIVHGQTTKDVNVTSDTMYLVLEACRIMDERNAGQKLSEGETHGSRQSFS